MVKDGEDSHSLYTKNLKDLELTFLRCLNRDSAHLNEEQNNKRISLCIMAVNSSLERIFTNQ